MSEINQLSIEELHIKIGENVKKYRELKKMSQIDLSQAIGHNATTMISLGEIGKGKHFNIEQLHKISIALDVDVCKFFEIE